MAYPTPAQIDAAIPVAGTPSRALTNQLLRDLVASLPTGTATQLATFKADGSLGGGVGFATAATANTVAQRGAGGVLLVGTPTANGHATTKQYVDNGVEGLSQNITGLAGRLTPVEIKLATIQENAVALGSTSTTAAAGNHSHGIATSTSPGFMSADDKAKLDALPAGGSGVTPTAAPTITISDPVDDESVQASFDALIAALKTAGVLT